MPAAQATIHHPVEDKEIAAGLRPLVDETCARLDAMAVDRLREFRFSWSEIDFTGRLIPDSAGDTVTLELCGALGSLPYTAESHALRQLLLRRLRSTSTPVPGIYRLTGSGQIRFCNETVLPVPVTATTVFTALAICLLQISPFIRIVDEVAKSAGNRPPHHRLAIAS